MMLHAQSLELLLPGGAPARFSAEPPCDFAAFSQRVRGLE
jgi:hypothetical protein